MPAYYNEFDPGAAAWLRELIKRGLIADGEVDERSIIDVTTEDIKGFTQCHFFAGIGGWSYALRLAGIPDDMKVWTGSPPCQPFSTAGQQKGKDDERHLAPHFASLVASGRPPVLFGEQVASAAVFGKAAKKARSQSEGEPEWAWIDDLQDRLEAAHYAVGASDIPAAGVGAPHIRQRTFFGAVRLADADGNGSLDGFNGAEGWRTKTTSEHSCVNGLADTDGRDARFGQHGLQQTDRGAGMGSDAQAGSISAIGRLADSCGEYLRGESGERIGSKSSSKGETWEWEWRWTDDSCGGSDVRLADSSVIGQSRQREMGRSSDSTSCPDREEHRVVDDGFGCTERSSPLNSFWRDADWLFCRDGKWRPVEPGTFPLAHGLPARVVRLRGYGNAIVPQAAAQFVRAFIDATQTS
jgi:DNA (cytosine-5)-methyltransferase 1